MTDITSHEMKREDFTLLWGDVSPSGQYCVGCVGMCMWGDLDSIVSAAWECACGVMFPHLDSIVSAAWECACGVIPIWTVLCRLHGNVRVG